MLWNTVPSVWRTHWQSFEEQVLMQVNRKLCSLVTSRKQGLALRTGL